MLGLEVLYNETIGMMLTFGSFIFLFDIYSFLHYIIIVLCSCTDSILGPPIHQSPPLPLESGFKGKIWLFLICKTIWYQHKMA